MTEPSPYVERHFTYGSNPRELQAKQTYKEIISPITLDEIRYEAAHQAWMRAVAAGDGMRGAAVYREFMKG